MQSYNRAMKDDNLTTNRQARIMQKNSRGIRRFTGEMSRVTAEPLELMEDDNVTYGVVTYEKSTYEITSKNIDCDNEDESENSNPAIIPDDVEVAPITDSSSQGRRGRRGQNRRNRSKNRNGNESTTAQNTEIPNSTDISLLLDNIAEDLLRLNSCEREKFIMYFYIANPQVGETLNTLLGNLKDEN